MSKWKTEVVEVICDSNCDNCPLRDLYCGMKTIGIPDKGDIIIATIKRGGK